jgi:UDP-N-acetylglucosamine--N-acetylmuramyl-(pentapeptide) pyrophosphoryl-undecaprenol N-acetylglucosamine transferase
MIPVSGKIVFAGGGTGGHVYPALAIIESLRQKGDFSILYIGGYRGIENSIIPSLGIPYRKIWISGFQRYLTLRNILFPLKVVVSLLQSFYLMLNSRPDVVVGTGGYVSGPVVYSAARLGIPTLVQEQDSFPGITTRLLARYSDIVCIPYDEVRQYLKKIRGKLLVAGVPVRSSLKLQKRELAVSHWGFEANKPVLFILGGSQGAQSLNRVISGLAEELIRGHDVQILWQTGKGNYEQVRQQPAAHNSRIVVKDYIDSMDMAYSAADIVVSRAGAITLAELAVVGKPCVLVPYPYAAAGHQEKNAQAIAGMGAALLVKEDDHFETNLKEAIIKLLENKNLAAALGDRWETIHQPDASGFIADQVINLMRKEHEDTSGKN